ncbi:MAG: hypothetical protein ACRDRH_29110 [Pseudonocardia sp.]
MRTIPEQFVTARLNGRPTPVQLPHRRWAAADYVPGAPESDPHEGAVVTITTPVGLALDDVVAVLFDWNMPDGELDDDSVVRELVAATVVSGGCLGVEELRCRLLGEAPRDAASAAYLAYCRERAAAVFGAGPCPRQASRTGRALTGVS